MAEFWLSPSGKPQRLSSRLSLTTIFPQSVSLIMQTAVNSTEYGIQHNQPILPAKIPTTRASNKNLRTEVGEMSFPHNRKMVTPNSETTRLSGFYPYCFAFGVEGRTYHRGGVPSATQEQLMYERRILSRVTLAGRQNVYVSSHTSPRNSRSS